MPSASTTARLHTSAAAASHVPTATTTSFESAAMHRRWCWRWLRRWCWRWLRRGRGRWCWRSATSCSPASMPATTGRMPRTAAHAVAATSSAASHLGVSIAEIANAVRRAERHTPRLQSCMQSSVVVPALLCWRWTRLLLIAGHLGGSICKRVISLVLLDHLAVMPAASVPASCVPAANMPATAARMHCAAAHAVAPSISATSHSGVLIAEIANAVRRAERHAPLLEGRLQASVIVPTLLRWRWARLLLRAGDIHETILYCWRSPSDLSGISCMAQCNQDCQNAYSSHSCHFAKGLSEPAGN